MEARHLYWILIGPSFAVHHDGKSTLTGEGGGARRPPFTLVTIIFNVAVYEYAPDERVDTLPLFHLFPCMFSVVVTPLTIFPFTTV